MSPLKTKLDSFHPSTRALYQNREVLKTVSFHIDFTNNCLGVIAGKRSFSTRPDAVSCVFCCPKRGIPRPSFHVDMSLPRAKHPVALPSASRTTVEVRRVVEFKSFFPRASRVHWQILTSSGSSWRANTDFVSAAVFVEFTAPDISVCSFLQGLDPTLRVWWSLAQQVNRSPGNLQDFA